MSQSVDGSGDSHSKAERVSHTRTLEDKLPDNLDNRTVPNSSSIKKEEKPVKLKRVLLRQDKVDIDMALGMDESIDNETVKMRPRKRRKCSIDTGFGEGNRLSSLTNRSSLSSVGSQDSVTSQLGKRLTIHSEFSLHES